MAALLNQNSNSGHLANVSSASFAHNAGSNAERFLAVLIAPGDATLSQRTVSNVTYAGSSITNTSIAADQGYERTEIWHKFAPSTGSNTVAVTMGGLCDNLDVYATSWYNVNQDALDASKGATQTAEDDVTETLTTNTLRATVISVIQTVNSQTSSVGTGQTEIGNLNGGWTRSSWSNLPVETGSKTHTYVVPGANNACMSLIAINEGSMVTGRRFYLPSSGSADISSVAFNAGWEDTSIGARLPTVITKQSTTMTTVSFVDANATNKDILFRQYVSDPLAAQTISAQVVAFVILAAERLATNNLFTAIDIRLVSNDGSVIRGTLVSMRRDGSEVVQTTLTSRNNNTGNSTAITCHSGDRLIMEVGLGGDPAVGSDHDGDLRIGDAASSDLAAGDGETTDNNPYIEFTTDLIFFTTGDIIVHEISSITPASGSTATLSHTVSANLSNAAVLVFAGAFDVTSADRNVNSVTYGGQNLTKLVEKDSDPTIETNDEIWILLSPPTGANNIIVTYSGTVTEYNVHAVTLGNVLQSGQPDATATDLDTATTTPAIAITTVTNRSFVFSRANFNNIGSGSVSGHIPIASTATGFWVSGYSGPKTPAGAVTHTYSVGLADDAGLVAVAIKQFVAAPAAQQTASFMTVGTGFWG